MTVQWKPGDVARIELHNGFVHPAALRLPLHEGGWATAAAKYVHSAQVSNARPLVVIDPEDREQVERLAKAWHVQPGVLPWDECDERDKADSVDSLADSLREFANPTPPKPEEPTGLGAIVEDASGEKWINFRDPAWPGQHQTPWVRISDTEIAAEYADLTAVKVLSEGVTP